MGRKFGLFTAVALLFGVIGALGWYALKTIRRPEATGLGSVPRDSVAVVAIDLARIRAYPPAERVRALLLAQPDVARAYGPVRAGCGVDPLEHIDSAIVAWGRTNLSTNGGVPVGVIAGRIGATQALPCATAIARAVSPSALLVPVAPVASHPVLAIVGAGETAASSEQRISPLGSRVVFASANALPHELTVIDRREAGADRNDRLRGAIGALGGDLLVYGVADIDAVTQALPHEWSLFATELASSPGVSGPLGGLASLLGVQSVAGGIQRVGSGLRGVFVATYHTPAEAQTASTLAAQSLSVVRGSIMTEVMRQQSEFMRQLTDAATVDASATAHVPPIQQAFTVLNNLYDRVTIHADGVSVRAQVDLPADEIATLEAGLRAMLSANRAINHAQSLRAPPATETPPPPPVPVPPPGVIEFE